MKSGNMASEKVTIPEGEVRRTISECPPNAPDSGYRVRYSVATDKYAAIGYYSESGTKALPNEATPVDVSSKMRKR